jgi:hypothetical protein
VYTPRTVVALVSTDCIVEAYISSEFRLPSFLLNILYKYKMKEKGFRHYKKQIVKPEEPVDNKQHFRRPPPVKSKAQNTPIDFEIFDGMKWTFNVSDDIKASLDSGTELLVYLL